MKKRKKILSLLLCAVTCASMTGSTVSAAEFDETIAMAADNSDELDFSADSYNFEEDTDAAANDAEVSEIAKTFNDAEFPHKNQKIFHLTMTQLIPSIMRLSLLMDLLHLTMAILMTIVMMILTTTAIMILTMMMTKILIILTEMTPKAI